MRNVLERSSARETAARVAAGAVAKKLLAELDINIVGYTKEIAGIKAVEFPDYTYEERDSISKASSVRCLDLQAAEQMVTAIDQAKKTEILSAVLWKFS